MITVVLFNLESISNVTIRVFDYLHEFNYIILRTTQDTIWLNGLYIKFNIKKKLVIINNYNNLMSKQEIADLLKSIFKGEEISLTITNNVKYYKCVDKNTDFMEVL